MSSPSASLFKQRLQEKGAPLFGLTLNTFDPVFVDVAGIIGMDMIWIEMEHSGMTMREAENLCRIISGNRMLSLIRLPNAEREVVLKAAETGADMLMVPMANEPATLHNFVRHARYSPQGERGFYVPSRALNYGLGGDLAELRRQANERLILWAQIETITALNAMEELCDVDGIDGMFMSPGDLSDAFGVPGEITHPMVVDSVTRGHELSRSHDRFCGTVCNPAEIHRWVQTPMDALFIGSNVSFYTNWAKKIKEQINEQIQLASECATLNDGKL